MIQLQDFKDGDWQKYVVPPVEEKREFAYVIVYFDSMAEKQIWRGAHYREEDAQECAAGLKLMGKHIYNIVKVELR